MQRFTLSTGRSKSFPVDRFDGQVHAKDFVGGNLNAGSAKEQDCFE